MLTVSRHVFLLALLAAALHGAGASVHAQEAPRFLAGPASRGAPDDLEREFTAFIRGACCTLDILVQEWDSEKLATALLERARGRTGRRRVKVRVVVEMDYLIARLPKEGTETVSDDALLDADDIPELEPLPPDSLERNRLIMLDFWRTGVDARSDYNPAIFHHKFAVRDFGKPTEAVWTGSMNFTDTDSRLNFNNAVILREPAIVKAYLDKFREAWSGAFGRRVKKSPKPLEPVPATGGGNILALFTPNNDAEVELVRLIDGANEEIRFAIFTFSGSSALLDALLRARDRGVACVGLFDNGQAAQSWSPDERLEGAGCRVHRSPPPGKLHHKFMVVDRTWLATGSFNYTRPANELNDENIVITDSPQLVAAALAEHRRMEAAFAKPVKKGTPAGTAPVKQTRRKRGGG